MLVQLLWVFVVLSIFGFGGGNAIIPQMHYETVDHFKWITSAQFSQYFALARLAPGPTTTMSALVGYQVDGWLGAVVATAGVFVPAMGIATIAGSLYLRLGDHPVRQIVAKAIGPIVMGLVWAGGWTIVQGALFKDHALDWESALLATVIFGLTLKTEVNTSLMILGAGSVGAIFLG
jgi:chromate transporter